MSGSLLGSGFVSVSVSVFVIAMATAITFAIDPLVIPAWAQEPGPLGPEWTEPSEPIREDLRILAAQGTVPLRAITGSDLLRSRIAGWWAERSAGGDAGTGTGRSAGSGPGGDASASNDTGIANRRVGRELAEEIQGLPGGRISAFPALTPFIDRPLGTARLRLRPYAWFEGTWRGGNDATWGDHPRAGVRGSLHLTPNLSLNEDMFAGRVKDGQALGDALVNHTDFLLFVESIDLTWTRGDHYVRVGRFRHDWGPGRNGDLLLSGSAPPMDQVHYGLALGPFSFSSSCGPLSRTAEKNVALHRLEWSPHPRFVLGLSEGATFPGSPFDPLYLLGLVPYSVLDRMHAQDVYADDDALSVRNNVLAQIDLAARIRSTLVWAEMLIDDVGTEDSRHPSRLGFLAGAETVFESHGLWSAGAEAAKVYDYVYSVYYEDSDWSHQGEAIGWPLGPDSESLQAFVSWQPSIEWQVRGEGIVLRHGEGRIGDPWYPPDDPRSSGNDSGPSSLRGVVERRAGGALSLAYEPSAEIRIALRASHVAIDNAGNVDGMGADDDRLELSVRWHR
ncbi:MAG: capsule assembly Wzi family protein [Candidatus Eisenbacteria bacterium]